MLRKHGNHHKHTEYSVNLDPILNVLLMPELFGMILNFMPVKKELLNLLNTCTALRNTALSSKLFFTTLCSIVEDNHNFIPICEEKKLKKLAVEFRSKNHSCDMLFFISSSDRIVDDGKLYTIHTAKYKKTPYNDSWGYYFEEWVVTTSLLPYIGHNGAIKMYKEEPNSSLIPATTFGKESEIHSYILKSWLFNTACYHQNACTPQGEADTSAERY